MILSTRGHGAIPVSYTHLIDLRPFHIDTWIEQVVAGGESGYESRPCDFDWVMDLRDVCAEHNVAFWFKQTGSKFIKDGKLYPIQRRLQHAQARKAGINFKSSLL